MAVDAFGRADQVSPKTLSDGLWFGGLSSSLGCDLGQMSHSVVSLARHISRCPKDVWMMEYKTEESNELKRKEVESNKECIKTNVERFMTFDSDQDIENEQETAAYNNTLTKGDLDIKLFIEKEIPVTKKIQKLQEDIQSVNGAAGFVPVMSSTSLRENINPNASDFECKFQQNNLEDKIDTGINVPVKFKWLKLQKANHCLNIAAGLLPEASSPSLDDKIDASALEYENEHDQKHLEEMNLRGRNIPVKHKLLQLRKAHQWLKAAAALLPAVSSASPGKIIEPRGCEFEHEFHQQNLEVKMDTGRNVATKHKLLKLQKATQLLNSADDLEQAMPISTFLGDNMEHSASQHKNQLEQQNQEVKILQRRNVPVKDKLIQLRKAHEWLKTAAALLPAMSSASPGKNIKTRDCEFEHELRQQNLDVKIDTGRNVAMKHKWLKLHKAKHCLNIAAGLLPEVSSPSLDDSINASDFEYENEHDQKHLEEMSLRGGNIPVKHKLIQLRKAHEWLKAAAAHLPAVSSASLGKNINPHASEYDRELQQQNLKGKTDTGRNVARKHKWLKLRKANQCVNIAAGLLTEVSSASADDGIDPSDFECEHELDQKNLEEMNLRGRNIPVKDKLLQLRKAHEWLKAAAALLPAVSSASPGKNIEPRDCVFEHELRQQSLDVKIDTGRNVAMKHKWLKLHKANHCLNIAAGLLPEVSSPSLDDSINASACEYENEHDQKHLEETTLRGGNVPVKQKLIQLRKAHEWVKAAADLLPALSSASPGKNIKPCGCEFEHELHQQNLDVKIDTGRNLAMKHQWLKLHKANHCLNIAAGLLPEVSSPSLDDSINASAFEYENEHDQKHLEDMSLRGGNVPVKHKLIQLRKAHEWLKAAAAHLPAVSSASLGKNIKPHASEYDHELLQQNLKGKTDTERNVARKHKWLKLRKANQCVNIAAGLLTQVSSASPDDGIDPSDFECEHELDQKNLEEMNLRGRNVPATHKLIQLRKAHEWLKGAAALLPAMSSASPGKNIKPRDCEFEHELRQQNLDVKIDTGRKVAMKHKLLKLQKATQFLNSADDLEPAMPISTLLGDNIDHSASQYKNQLEQSLEMKILRGRNIAVKDKLLQLQNDIQYLNAAPGFLPAKSSASLDKNIDLSSSDYKHQVQQKKLEMMILRERHIAVKRKLLKLCNANKSISVPPGLVTALPALTSLGDNADPCASEYDHQLELKDMDYHSSSTYQHLQNRMTCWI